MPIPMRHWPPPPPPPPLRLRVAATSSIVLFISSLDLSSALSRARPSITIATKLLGLLAHRRYSSRDTETLSNKGAGYACRRKPCLRSQGERAPEHLTGYKPSSTAPVPLRGHAGRSHPLSLGSVQSRAPRERPCRSPVSRPLGVVSPQPSGALVLTTLLGSK